MAKQRTQGLIITFTADEHSEPCLWREVAYCTLQALWELTPQGCDHCKPVHVCTPHKDAMIAAESSRGYVCKTCNAPVTMRVDPLRVGSS